MIQEIIDKLEREIKLRKNMPHNHEQVPICYGLNRAKDIVSAMEEPGWIPVSERLPDEATNPVTRDAYVYSVTIETGGVTDVRYYSFCKGHWRNTGKVVDNLVIAWMPRPEPYKPGN